MDTSFILVLTLLPTFAIGGAIGATVAYLYSKARVATLEAEHAADLEKIDWIRNSQQALRETFGALAAKALHKNAKDFSGRIEQQLGSHATHIGTLKSSLEANINKIDQNICELERKREAAYQGLTQNVANLQRAYAELRDTTAQLLNALKSDSNCNEANSIENGHAHLASDSNKDGQPIKVPTKLPVVGLNRSESANPDGCQPVVQRVPDPGPKPLNGERIRPVTQASTTPEVLPAPNVISKPVPIVVTPICERCSQKPRVLNERFCKECRKAVLKELAESGYLTTNPPGPPSEMRGRKEMRSSEWLSHQCHEDDYGEEGNP